MPYNLIDDLQKLQDSQRNPHVQLEPGSYNIITAWINYGKGNSLKSNIAYILHQADSMATHIEYDEWENSQKQEEIKVQGNVENIKKAVTMKETSEELSKKSKDLFDELFGDK